MFDLIGDIHGYAERLETLLLSLGYQKTTKGYAHPTRRAIFLGDVIDRGPEQVKAYRMVRAMVEAGNADLIMGNHEYNAVAYATPHPTRAGEYLRAHSDSNLRQHRTFLDQVGEGSALHGEIIDWFRSLPIYIDAPDFRAIHACWHAEHVTFMQPFLDANNALLPHAWYQITEKNTPAYNALETLLKGTEIELPAGVTYLDQDGNERCKTRTRWWDEQAKTYRQAGLIGQAIADRLPDEEIPAANLLTYDQAKLVFFGHYWMSGTPQRLSERMACLDYSIGKGTRKGKLCAYRWHGEATLREDGFVWVEHAAPVHTLESESLEP
jgi:hypothetical protein